MMQTKGVRSAVPTKRVPKSCLKKKKESEKRRKSSIAFDQLRVEKTTERKEKNVVNSQLRDPV